MNRFALGLPLALTLAACAPATVRTDDARLTATARTPVGVFAFDCNPALNARQGGVALTLSDQTSFACPSTDGRATLALSVFTVTSPPAPTPRPVPGQPAPPPAEPTRRSETQARVLLVLPSAAGGVPVTYTGQPDLRPFEQVNFPRRHRLRGEFRADLGGGVNVQGRFNLVGE